MPGIPLPVGVLRCGDLTTKQTNLIPVAQAIGDRVFELQLDQHVWLRLSQKTPPRMAGVLRRFGRAGFFKANGNHRRDHHRG